MSNIIIIYLQHFSLSSQDNSVALQSLSDERWLPVDVLFLQRVVRGILCDVWVAERGVRKGQYYTVEVFFSHENWTVEVEVFNKVRQVPIGISSYIADVVSPLIVFNDLL